MDRCRVARDEVIVGRNVGVAARVVSLLVYFYLASAAPALAHSQGEIAVWGRWEELRLFPLSLDPKHDKDGYGRDDRRGQGRDDDHNHEHDESNDKRR